VDPANAILNYAYEGLEGQCRQALAKVLYRSSALSSGNAAHNDGIAGSATGPRDKLLVILPVKLPIFPVHRSCYGAD
jgi:hypothetical protein